MLFPVRVQFCWTVLVFVEPLSRLGTVRIFSSSGRELTLASISKQYHDDDLKITRTVIVAPLVDGDPHFVVSLAKLHENMCFTVDGRADDVLRLVEDPGRGMSMWTGLHPFVGPVC